MVNELELACKYEKKLAERLLQIFAKYNTPVCEEKVKMETYHRLKVALQPIKGVETGFAPKLASTGHDHQTKAQGYGNMFISIPVTTAQIQRYNSPNPGTGFPNPMAG